MIYYTNPHKLACFNFLFQEYAILTLIEVKFSVFKNDFKLLFFQIHKSGFDQQIPHHSFLRIQKKGSLSLFSY